MNPRKVKLVEPNIDHMFDPYSEPRTIPVNWDVSAFYAPEQENLGYHGTAPYNSKSSPSANASHESTENTL